MAALSFIGKPISLISHSDVRYRGILAGIDPVASTIQLSNVYSMGTESRRPPNEYIPPVQDPYTYIIFRASEVKDLAVDDSATQRRNVHDDPAVIGASAPPMAPNVPGYGSPSFPQQAPAAFPPQQGQGQVPPRQQQQFANRQQPTQPSGSQQQPNAAPNAPAQANGAAPAAPRNARNQSVNSVTASMETIERAIGDLRVTNGNGNGAQRGGRRGGGRNPEPKAGDLRVPTTDFDFQTSNARFDKAALAPSPRGTPKIDGEDGEVEEDVKEKDTAYNPEKSFFDTLSSGSNGPNADGRGRGGRRGGGRNRREEERERNVATFGEAGGARPNAYAGGWGGYGRRGNGRGRRGGAAVGTRS
ncbi:Scd6-like Sm domain-containing protein [Epithele typhae]|uniref:Scd6-like Sm domain-containing protein n=1 Tax=Epithele typhae TaxID=378194 RepID=UPI002007C5E1|nr:Scd6-like Sm domain-containing protein [Epithele typhae]KAH9945778.1 Scd6-like Sm domain-containing protein [Epithele typhae]